tara:strand:+ start:312 stop:485 length:174 start_codon:yes stop_codon:yes gene_type:complete
MNGLGCKSPLFRIDAPEIKSQIIYFKVFKKYVQISDKQKFYPCRLLAWLFAARSEIG